MKKNQTHCEFWTVKSLYTSQQAAREEEMS